MYKIIFLLFIQWVFVNSGSAQFKHINLFQGQRGNELLSALISEYKTNTVLPYNNARDTLFSKIEAIGDSLECIYTGMRLYLTPGADPTESVYLAGIANGINTEHAWPQAKGANGQAQSDMHHLYPSRIKTNSDRGDNPLGEIPDNETKTWYYRNTERNTIPNSGRDLYAESKTGKFEPRESVKGNLARSLFYFYTMYKEQADALDPGFFNKMKSDLCEWHNLDPVDEREWLRNQKVATYQGGKLNPYILDCSLVSRAFCNNIDQACEAIILSQNTEFLFTPAKNISIFPNPGYGDVYFKIESAVRTTYKIAIYDYENILVKSLSADIMQGDNLLSFNFSDTKPGLFFVKLENVQTGLVYYTKLVIVR